MSGVTLTEAEREALMFAMCAPDPDRAPVTEIQLLHLNAVVERIVAARVQQAEEHAIECERIGVKAIEDRIMAEVERDALRERVERVGALADQWEAGGPHGTSCRHAAALRAALDVRP